MEREHLVLRGHMKGHSGWVTQIAMNPAFPNMLLSSSRGALPRAPHPRRCAACRDADGPAAAAQTRAC